MEPITPSCLFAGGSSTPGSSVRSPQLRHVHSELGRRQDGGSTAEEGVRPEAAVCLRGDGGRGRHGCPEGLCTTQDKDQRRTSTVSRVGKKCERGVVWKRGVVWEGRGIGGEGARCWRGTWCGKGHGMGGGVDYERGVLLDRGMGGRGACCWIGVWVVEGRVVG